MFPHLCQMSLPKTSALSLSLLSPFLSAVPHLSHKTLKWHAVFTAGLVFLSLLPSPALAIIADILSSGLLLP